MVLMDGFLVDVTSKFLLKAYVPFAVQQSHRLGPRWEDSFHGNAGPEPQVGIADRNFVGPAVGRIDGRRERSGQCQSRLAEVGSTFIHAVHACLSYDALSAGGNEIAFDFYGTQCICSNF